MQLHPRLWKSLFCCTLLPLLLILFRTINGHDEHDAFATGFHNAISCLDVLHDQLPRQLQGEEVAQQLHQVHDNLVQAVETYDRLDSAVAVLLDHRPPYNARVYDSLEPLNQSLVAALSSVELFITSARPALRTQQAAVKASKARQKKQLNMVWWANANLKWLPRHQVNDVHVRVNDEQALQHQLDKLGHFLSHLQDHSLGHARQMASIRRDVTAIIHWCPRGRSLGRASSIPPPVESIVRTIVRVIRFYVPRATAQETPTRPNAAVEGLQTSLQRWRALAVQDVPVFCRPD